MSVNTCRYPTEEETTNICFQSSLDVNSQMLIKYASWIAEKLKPMPSTSDNTALCLIKLDTPVIMSADRWQSNVPPHFERLTAASLISFQPDLDKTLLLLEKCSLSAIVMDKKSTLPLFF